MFRGVGTPEPGELVRGEGVAALGPVVEPHVDQERRQGCTGTKKGRAVAGPPLESREVFLGSNKTYTTLNVARE